jgi:hypothetical protein
MNAERQDHGRRLGAPVDELTTDTKLQRVAHFSDAMYFRSSFRDGESCASQRFPTSPSMGYCGSMGDRTRGSGFERRIDESCGVCGPDGPPESGEEC